MMHQNAVFRLERDDVGDCPERDEIEPLSQIEIRKRAGLEQSVAEFEDNSDTAEIVEGRVSRRLGLTTATQSGSVAFRLVMIEHDHIRAACTKIGNFRRATKCRNRPQ